MEKPKKSTTFAPMNEGPEKMGDDGAGPTDENLLMAFKTQQRRRSSIARLPLMGAGQRRPSAVSVDSRSQYSSSDEENEGNPRESPQKNSSGFGDFCVRQISQASVGRKYIKLAEQEMHGVMSMREKISEKPLKGAKISCCTHVNAQTAVMIETLILFGAKVRWCSCNIYSTQNEVAAAVAEAGVSVYAWRGEEEADFWWCIDKCISDSNWHPNLIMDDGGDLTDRMARRQPTNFSRLKGIVEENSTGIHRLYQLSKTGKLPAPAMRISEAVLKSKFDGYYSCKESLIDALKRLTDVMLGGLKVVVCGYGLVGRGCASALKAVGANVCVTEVDPVCALQACMEGFLVTTLEDVIENVDCVVSCTGNKKVVRRDHMNRMKSGCIVCNMGHPYLEIDVASIKTIELTWERVRPQVDHIIWPDGKHIILLCEGRLANLGCITSPSFYASISATTQILAILEFFTAPPGRYEKNVYLPVKKIDDEVARMHLPKFGGKLTLMTAEQLKFFGIKT